VSVVPLLHVVAIDLALSGDNAIVIGLAARGLPPRQRRLAVAAGTAGAVLLRFLLTFLAARLLEVPYLHLVGGVLLLGVAYRSLSEGGAEAAHAAQAPAGLLEAMGTIVVADAAMSLDNVLGVAAAAGENTFLLLAGLALSVGLMMLAGNVMATVLNRGPWLAFAGAAVVAWTGASLALRDPAVPAALAAGRVAIGLSALAAVGVPLAGRLVARRGESAAP
jgi:YjbE family integral membrane protein